MDRTQQTLDNIDEPYQCPWYILSLNTHAAYPQKCEFWRARGSKIEYVTRHLKDVHGLVGEIEKLAKEKLDRELRYTLYIGICARAHRAILRYSATPSEQQLYEQHTAGKASLLPSHQTQDDTTPMNNQTVSPIPFWNAVQYPYNEALGSSRMPGLQRILSAPMVPTDSYHGDNLQRHAFTGQTLSIPATSAFHVPSPGGLALGLSSSPASQVPFDGPRRYDILPSYPNGPALHGDTVHEYVTPPTLYPSYCQCWCHCTHYSVSFCLKHQRVEADWMCNAPRSPCCRCEDVGIGQDNTAVSKQRLSRKFKP
jgi:hypothetical protein